MYGAPALATACDSVTVRSAASGSVAPEPAVTVTACPAFQFVVVNTSSDGATATAVASPLGAAAVTVTSPLGRLFSATV